MAGLRVVIITALLTVFILNVVGHKHHNRPCTNDPDSNPFDPPCPPAVPVTPPIPDVNSNSDSEETSSSSTAASTTASTTTTTIDDGGNLTALERAHWCRFSNGSFLPYGQTFMNSICSMCQCTKSRAIRCQLLECLPTYCIDNTMPYRKDGQCCAQCGYEVARNSCVYNGITFPHGVVMRTVSDKMQCWCQLGSIECRNYVGSLMDSLNMLTDETTIYIIVMVLFVVLLFGLCVCCACTLSFYYYYKHYEHTFQEVYDQYNNSAAGWQPMNEEEQYEVEVDGNAEKQVEDEKSQSAEYNNDMFPPPYGAHADGEQKK
ncbi:unnamed protein product [Adineta steineri]|uniref:VWFC domain-containing protein n=1 Tax=Adineta steineri TaxID=433720 RepID=A0A818MZZ8_9BILA|nr:unnamed protein product [Adineta steineri]CAF3597537.1 unnamed protein product [Adineta steineri]